MPATPYAHILMVIDGGSPVSGGQTVSGGNTIQLAGENTSSWTSQLWEIYEYPDGFACPTGWTNINGIYQSNALIPTAFDIDDDTNWGKYFFRLTVNDGLLNGVVQGPDSGQPLVDIGSALSVLSANGVRDIGFGEKNQFDSFRLFIGELKKDLRIFDGLVSGGTINLPGGSDGQFQYKNGSAFAGSSGFIYDSVNSRAQAVASLAIKNSANALQAIISATAQTGADHTFTIPNISSDTFVFLAATQTLTNKTFNVANNSLTATSGVAGDILVHNGTKFVRQAQGADGTFWGVSGGVSGFYTPAGGASSVGTNTVQISDGVGAFLSAANATYVGGFLILATALKLSNSGFATSLASGTLSGNVTATLPAATTRLMGFDTTDTMTNKTFNVAGTGNVLTGSGAGAAALLVHDGTKFNVFNPTGASPGQVIALNATSDGYVFVDNGSGGGGGGGTLPNVVELSGSTTGTTPTDLLLSDLTEIVLSDNTVYSLYIDVTARQTNGTNDASKFYKAMVRTLSGTATIDAGPDMILDQDTNGYTVAITASGGLGLRIRVTGLSGQNIDWRASVTTGGPLVSAGGGSGSSSDGAITTVQTSNGAGGFTGATGFLAGSQFFNLQTKASAPASPASGNIFYVDVVDGKFKYKNADGRVTVLGASSGDASVLTQDAWYIDPSAGDDTDTGAVGHPLKTFAELRRRWGVGATIVPTSGTCTVNLLGSLPITDGIRLRDLAVGTDCILLIKGTRTTVRSGSFTATTTLVRSTSTPWDGTDSALAGANDWLANVGERVRITSGAHSGNIMWVAKNLGSKKARLSAPANAPIDGSLHVTLGSITSSDPYAVETLSDVYIDEVAIGGQWGSFVASGSLVLFSDVNVAGILTAINSPDVLTIFSGCSFDSGLNGFTGSSGPILLNCALRCAGEAMTLDGAETSIESGLVLNGVMTLIHLAIATIDGDTLFQTSAINIGNGSVVQSGTVGVFDSAADAVTVGISDTAAIAGGNAIFRSQNGVFSAHTLYGSGNTGVAVVVGALGRLLYQTTAPVISGSADFKLGGATSGFGFDMTAGTFIGSTTFTWAHLVAALGAGTGFGHAAHNPDKDAHLLKTA